MAWLSLYRNDSGAHYSEAERSRYTRSMAHLHEAMQINPLLEVHRQFDANRPDGKYRGRSICVSSRVVRGLLFLHLRRRALLDGLSPRERQVALSVAQGQSAKESGRALGLAHATVRVHMKRIYAKLGLHSQGELAYLLGSSQQASASAGPAVIREAG